MHLPGMVHTKILRPPAHGARLIHADTSAAEKIKGVQIIRDGDRIAALHTYPDEAEQALKKIKAEYDLPQTGVDHDTIFEYLLKNAPEPAVAAEAGDLAKGETSAASVIEGTYLNSYVAHAPMKPHTALASVDAQKTTAWASTQTPFSTQGPGITAVAKRFGWSSARTPSGRGHHLHGRRPGHGCIRCSWGQVAAVAHDTPKSQAGVENRFKPWEVKAIKKAQLTR